MAEDKKHGDKNFSNQAKKSFLEIVSTYGKYQEMLDRKSDISKIAETLGGITEAARMLAINEADDWFDAHTVKRNMSELEKLGKQFDKCAVDAKSLDQRLNGLYEDMGHILSRYYKVGDISEDEVKQRLGMNEGKINEMDRMLNKKVKTFLDTYLKGDKPNSPEHQFAIMTIMKGALTDANFHSEAKQLDKFFPKAKQVDDKYLKMADVIEDKGIQISKWAKWDGHDIIDAFSYYTNMTIGGGFGNKLETLKESIIKEGKSEAQQTAIAFENAIKALSAVQTQTWINNKEHDQVLKIKDALFKMGHTASKRIMNEGLEPGDKLIHKHNKDISIELIATTNRGWKVKQTEPKGARSKKTTTQYYNDQDLKGDKALFESKSPCSCGCGTCDKALTENTLMKSSLAELDTLAKKSNNFRVFINEVYKEFPNLPKNNNSVKWLEETYKKNESVNEAKMTPLKSVGSYIDSKGVTYPMLANGKPDLSDDGVPFDEVDDEWLKALSSTDRKIVKQFESVNESEYVTSTSSYIDKHNNEFKMAEKLNKGNEVKFYDELSGIEEKIGHPKYMKWLSNALRGYKVDMFKDPKIKNKGEAEEALFFLSK